MSNKVWCGKCGHNHQVGSVPFQRCFGGSGASRSALAARFARVSTTGTRSAADMEQEALRAARWDAEVDRKMDNWLRAARQGPPVPGQGDGVRRAEHIAKVVAQTSGADRERALRDFANQTAETAQNAASFAATSTSVIEAANRHFAYEKGSFSPYTPGPVETEADLLDVDGPTWRRLADASKPSHSGTGWDTQFWDSPDGRRHAVGWGAAFDPSGKDAIHQVIRELGD